MHYESVHNKYQQDYHIIPHLSILREVSFRLTKPFPPIKKASTCVSSCLRTFSNGVWPSNISLVYYLCNTPLPVQVHNMRNVRHRCCTHLWWTQQPVTIISFLNSHRWMLSNKNHVQVLVTNISKGRNNSITKWTNMSRTDTNYTVVKSSRYLAKARASSDGLKRHVRVSADPSTPRSVWEKYSKAIISRIWK